ncbi:energy transducer TonB family protein [Roseibium algae]|uniref:Protein TonB n=1 Tax=Roseibium algae TaxID=3123038 RepID=A0ABU8TJP2_9HYPH
MKDSHNISPGWRWLALALVLSLGLHMGIAAWATLSNKDEILTAGGAETSAATIGQAFENMLIAGTAMPVAEPEEADLDDMVEPVEDIETPIVQPQPVEATSPEPVETIQSAQLDSAIAPSLTSTVINSAAEGKFIKAEKTLEKPLEAEPIIQELVEPVEEPVLQKPAEKLPELKSEKPEDAPLSAKAPIETVPAPEKTDPLKEIKPQQLTEVKPELTKPVETIEPIKATPPDLEQPELPTEVAQSDIVPVPQLRPKPLVRDPPKKVKRKTKQKSAKKPKKTAKKSNTATGAGGGSKRTAQKGGAVSKGRSSEAGNAKVSNYKGKVRRKLKRSLRYPRAAQRKRITGVAVVSFTLDSAGRASRIRIVRSSGSALLDKAALDTARRASPFGNFPPEYGKKSWPFTIPLSFE